MKIGICGWGFVGQAIAFGLKNKHKIIPYDPYQLPESKLESLLGCKFIFLSVPTPMTPTGELDCSIIGELVYKLSELNYKGLVVIKSTVTPIFIHELINRHSDIKILVNPEFLTERFAHNDFITTRWVIIGGDRIAAEELLAFYKDLFDPNIPHAIVTAEAAAMMKLSTNTIFSSKIAVFNELRKLWDSFEYGPWEDVIEAIKLDDRISNHHTSVPGPDGQWGFGGKCFPKDLNGMIYLAQIAGTLHNTISGAWKTNLEVRNLN